MSKHAPHILGFANDLLYTSKIDATAHKLGYTTEWIDSAAHFGEGDSTKKRRPGEPLETGQIAKLTAYISKNQPELLIFDLDNKQIPWQRWIAILKSSPATRRTPILAYGAHIDTPALEKAHKAGADGVVTRGRLSEKTLDLINKYAKRLDYMGIENACAQPLSELARAGIELFNQQQFYEAHHGLEDAWNDDKGPARDMYRAILQVAVAYLQIERGNYRGALKMFLRVRQWLEPLPDNCRTINIAQLRTDAEAANSALMALGADNISDFDRTYFKPITFTTTS